MLDRGSKRSNRSVSSSTTTCLNGKIWKTSNLRPQLLGNDFRAATGKTQIFNPFYDQQTARLHLNLTNGDYYNLCSSKKLVASGMRQILRLCLVISKSENGLKQSLKIIEDYASKWKMKINTDKTKVLIFNKPGKVEKSKSFKLCDESIEVCKNFKYLGFLLNCNGNFGNTMEDLAKKGKRVLYGIYKLSTHDYIPIKTIIKVFNATIKLILYSTVFK